MKNNTEQQIKNAFIRLLYEMPANKITVNKIVSFCGLNRNTFYYYFTDIPCLIEKVIQDKINDVMLQFEEVNSLENCLDPLFLFAKNNKQILKNLYISTERSFLERSLWKICNQLAAVCTEKFTRGYEISKLDHDLFILDFKCVFFGFLMEWMESGMKDNLTESIRRLCEIKSGVIECMLNNSERRPL